MERHFALPLLLDVLALLVQKGLAHRRKRVVLLVEALVLVHAVPFSVQTLLIVVIVIVGHVAVFLGCRCWRVADLLPVVGPLVVLVTRRRQRRLLISTVSATSVVSFEFRANCC